MQSILYPVAMYMSVAAICTTCSQLNKSRKSDEPAPQLTPTANENNEVSDLCLTTHKAQCDELDQQVEELRTQRETAVKSNNVPDLNRTMLEMNYRLEKRALLSSKATLQGDFDLLDEKYAELHKILEKQLADDAALPPMYGRPDGVAISRIVYHELELKTVSEIMHTFGDLYIEETPGNDAGAIEYSTSMPWSGYWYPVTGTELFGTESSPLQKFDRAVKGSSASWEKSHRLQNAETWEGLCGAWSVASVLTKEPSAPVYYHGETFSISDQKALLTKAYERFPTKNYGIRYNGDEVTDGTRADIRPEAFHRLAEVFLHDRKTPFIIDDTAGIEVWNKPVYRMRMRITKDPDIANSYLVKAWPWLVRQRYDVKDNLTSISDRYAPAPYEYRLYVHPTQQLNGRQRVIAGEWINASVENHPDYVVIPDANGRPLSANPSINEKIESINAIINQK